MVPFFIPVNGTVSRLGLICILLFLMSGCHSVQFYHQAIVGQTSLLMQREDIGKLLEDENTPADLHARLELAGEILEFARKSGLPEGKTYSSYVETGKPFVVWNVFAAEPYSLTLKTFCFPIAGCVSYRGYFERELADEYAAHLVSQGYEVYVGGVAAYSTLGWFEDPLLDTFLFRSEVRLAALLFHELAHQLIYVPGDTRFNESVATAVEQFVLKAWLSERGLEKSFGAYMASEKRREAVLVLISEARDQLRDLYDSGVSEDEMRTQKARVIGDLVRNYSELKATWKSGSEFESWMAGEINNAKLETVADYNEWVPVFTTVLEHGGLEELSREVNELARLSNEERQAELERRMSAL